MAFFYPAAIAALLLLSGAAHIVMPHQTERWMSRISVVQGTGALLLLLAVPSLVLRGWFFWTLFFALTVSGIWRLGFPGSSIRAQQRSYPRWVHGCLLTGGAVLVWMLRP